MTVARALAVIRAGPFTSMQDLGRPGLAALGVGRSGVADQGSAALANRLVANPRSAAVLEMAFGGLVVRALSPLTVALTGAVGRADIDGRPSAYGAPLALVAGAVLAVGPPSTGLRTYLAVRGGFVPEPVLGSRSYDVLARLGPPPLRDGDTLPVGPEPRRLPSLDHVAVAAVGSADDVVTGTVLRGWFGPHEETLPAAAAAGLVTAVWTVGADSDRSGVRLSGHPLARTSAAESPPEGLVRGAVQLPSSGQPVVMLADHPLTGGYPVIGALDLTSCDRAAQLRPGDRVRLALAGRRSRPSVS